jgi:hypothetical protein
MLILQSIGIVVLACLVIWAVQKFSTEIPPFLVKVIVVGTVVIAVVVLLMLWGAMPAGLLR